MLAPIETRPAQSAGHAPGYVHNAAPDRYPTRADWPAPGTRGTLNGRPVVLMEIWHAYRALFQTGRYSTCNANLQHFIANQPEN